MNDRDERIHKAIRELHSTGFPMNSVYDLMFEVQQKEREKMGIEPNSTESLKSSYDEREAARKAMLQQRANKEVRDALRAKDLAKSRLNSSERQLRWTLGALAFTGFAVFAPSIGAIWLITAYFAFVAVPSFLVGIALVAAVIGILEDVRGYRSDYIKADWKYEDAILATAD